MRFLVSIALVFFPSAVFADLYRWIDPDTGSVKFSSYPPPWFGDPAEEKRAPKVEHIPERAPAAAAQSTLGAAPAGAPASTLDDLDARRKILIQQLASLPGQPDLRSGALRQQLEAFAKVTAEMDRLDPRGADARRTEAQPVLEKLIDAARLQTKPPTPGLR